MLEKPCQITITHKTNPEGNVKDRITGISMMHEDLVCPDQEGESFVYEIAQHPKNWDRLPPWAKDEVKASDEYKALVGEDASVHNDVEEVDAPAF